MKKSERDKLRSKFQTDKYGISPLAAQFSYLDIYKLLDYVDRLEDALKLALSFAPKGPVPKGLDPTFYHTLNYESEVKLQERVDLARKALEGSGEC